MTQKKLIEVLENQPYPLLFATISGAHLYGFPSADSDYDIRGVHLLPLREIVGLQKGRETIEFSEMYDSSYVDLVTHEAKKFCAMLLKKNGYVLEQLFSPLILKSFDGYTELKNIAKRCVTRYHCHHYLGFAKTQWNLFEEKEPLHIKPLLYVYRVLLTGIHLMKTGEVESNLIHLNSLFDLPYLDDLVQAKIDGIEKGSCAVDVEFHRSEYYRLRELLYDASSDFLPEIPDPEAVEQLNELLIELRFAS